MFKCSCSFLKWLSLVRKSGGGGRSVYWKLKRDRKGVRKKETGVFRLTGLVTRLATGTIIIWHHARLHAPQRDPHKLISWAPTRNLLRYDFIGSAHNPIINVYIWYNCLKYAMTYKRVYIYMLSYSNFNILYCSKDWGL